MSCQTLEEMHDEMWDQGIGRFPGAPPLGRVIALLVANGYLKRCRDHRGGYLRDPDASPDLLTQAIDLAARLP